MNDYSGDSNESSFAFHESETSWSLMEESTSDDADFYLQSAGGHLIRVHRRILQESKTIQRLCEFFDSMEEEAVEPQGPCGTSWNPFPLPSLGIDILKAIATWVNEHSCHYTGWRTMTDAELINDPQNAKEWKGLRTATVDGLFNSAMFFELLKAAEFLEMPSLIVASTKYLAACLSNLTADEIRRVYRIPRDCTADEEDEVADHILRLQVQLPIEADYDQLESSPLSGE